MRLIAALVLLLALSACSLPVFFRVPVVQGNIVTADQVDKLDMGMTKRQVAYVLGTPLIKAPFETNRWDYVFYYRNPRAHVRQSKLDLYFANDRLVDIDGDEEYRAAVAKIGQQTGPTSDAPMPGATGSTGAPLGARALPDNEPADADRSGELGPADDAPIARPVPAPTGTPTGPSGVDNGGMVPATPNTQAP